MSVFVTVTVSVCLSHILVVFFYYHSYRMRHVCSLTSDNLSCSWTVNFEIVSKEVLWSVPGSYQTIWGPPLPNVTLHSGWWPYTVTPSIYQALHQFLTLLLIWTLLPSLTFYLIARGFHITFATGAACQQRTLTTPDTCSCPTLGLASVLMLRPISLELVLFPDFWVSNIPRYFGIASYKWSFSGGHLDEI